MSPQTSRPNTGRYQSQLLNFVNRQSQRLRDQGGIFLRRVKQATLWGGQIALYPIYALFQASRVASRQIGTKFRQALYQLRPAQEVPADLSIHRVLEALNPDTASSTTLNPAARPSIANFRIGARPPKLAMLEVGQTVNAIASSLETHQLLLVTEHNELLDILTIEQQQQLQARIVWELASYWKLWRQWQQHMAVMQLPTRPSIKLPGAAGLAITDRPQLTTPARLFYQLMAWVQQGPLANRINWFDEITLIDQPQTDWFHPHLGQLPTDALIRSNAVTGFDWEAWTEDLPQTNPVARLLKAAIHHFFGRSPQTFKSAAPQPAVADPWEGPIDVEFVEPTTPTSKIQTAELTAPSPVLQVAAGVEPRRLPTTPIAAVLPPAQPRRSLGQKLSRLVKQTVGKVTQTTQATTGKMTGPATVQAASPYSNVQAAMPPLTAATAEGGNLTWANVFANDLTTTLIDTVATPIGYAKHPLEKLLGWLDQALLWAETQVAKLWQWANEQRNSMIQRWQRLWQK
ncbi:hypothetical protein IQ266_19720 [filamentous cyanobacterium LEGE 11480]|uniref:Uncharacterized protein n=1 Tax=Romeriopsis navalis LEGE 11480 TaxID=2777977 RepID=A0A928Z4P3_9CYAN|nr:hypothetical protein [Romeriopsis navalis]MBE9031969.1 hypothetical protein [Romeriopsis navalis LEGE 11480]